MIPILKSKVNCEENDQIFNPRDKAYNNNFYQLGYISYQIYENNKFIYFSFGFIIFIYFLLLIIQKFFINHYKLRRIYYFFQKKICYTFILRYLREIYFPLCILAFLNLIYLDFTTAAHALCSISSFIFLILIVLFPILMGVFLHKN